MTEKKQRKTMVVKRPNPKIKMPKEPLIKKSRPAANQWLLDPRQEACWAYYIDPTSDSFSVAVRSAIKAGYSKVSAGQVTQTEWWKARKRRMGLLGKAEKALDEALDVCIVATYYNKDGEEVSKIDSGILKAKNDVAKFIASTQGKVEGYTTKTETEVSGALNIGLTQYKDSIVKCSKCNKPTLSAGVCQKCSNLKIN